MLLDTGDILCSAWDEASYMWLDRYEGRVELYPCPMPMAWRHDMRGCQIESSRLRFPLRFRDAQESCNYNGSIMNYFGGHEYSAKYNKFWEDKLDRPLEEYLARMVMGKLRR